MQEGHWWAGTPYEEGFFTLEITFPFDCVLVDVFPADETKPTPHVLKITKPVVTARLGIKHDDNAALTELLKAEVRMPVEAYRLAERWNALGISPKPIRFNPVYVVQLKRQPPQVGRSSNRTTRAWHTTHDTRHDARGARVGG